MKPNQHEMPFTDFNLAVESGIDGERVALERERRNAALLEADAMQMRLLNKVAENATDAVRKE